MARNATRHRIREEVVAVELQGLSELPDNTLRERWQEMFGTAPPSRTSHALLVRAVGHRLQEKATGGRVASVRRRLDRAASNLDAGRTPNTTSTTIKPGTRLLREWQGRMHEVIILEEGALYDGRTWTSLSAVAREITGARWSGPRFFGLKGQSRDA